jgi:hypothetical protein
MTRGSAASLPTPGLAALVAALLAFSACTALKDPNDRAVDAGRADAGPRDLGSRQDFGSGDDLGSVRPDFGPDPSDAGCASLADAMAPLPTANLPRCSSTTRAAVVACGVPTTPAIETCIYDAIMADPTPVTYIGGRSVNCADCYGLQQLACFYSGGCARELEAFFCCCPGGNPSSCTACSAQQSAMNACVAGHPECVDVSVSGPVSDCFVL